VAGTTTGTDDAHALAAFADSLDEFMHAIRRAQGRFGTDEVSGHQLSLSQYHVLEPLARAAEPLTVGAIAAAAGLASPTVTRTVDGLERRGLCARLQDSDDRRVVLVELTPEGRRAVAAKQRRIERRRGEIFDQLSPGERREAARLLSRLAAAIDHLR
jgi:MarR family transcriptional regulator, organic hydroperoxide resistance regulator